LPEICGGKRTSCVEIFFLWFNLVSKIMDKPFNKAETAQSIQMLEIGFKTLKLSHDFQPGMLVRWKKGMKNRQRPAYGEPVIVVEVLLNPIFDKKFAENSESALFREPLDLVLGFYPMENEEFILMHFDSRRFEPLSE
jgi:hypothetical protein